MFMKCFLSFHWSSPMTAAAIMLAAFAGPVGTASANMIGVNICNYAQGLMATTDLAGAPGVRVDNWHNLTGPSPYLHEARLNAGTGVDNKGIAQSGVSVSMVWPKAGYAQTMTPAISGGNDANLFSANENQWGTPAGTFTVRGLKYKTYDVYVYVYNDTANPGRGGSITMGTNSYYIATGKVVGNPTSNGKGYVISTDTTKKLNRHGTLSNTVGNYVKFTGLSGSSFTASYVGLGSVPRIDIVGFQVVATTHGHR